MKLTRFFHLNISALFIIVLGGLLLTACGTSSSTSSGGSTGNSGTSSCASPPKLTKTTGLKVGFSQNENTGPWRLAETKSMQTEAAAQGDQLIFTDAQSSASKQISDVDSLIAQKVDIIVLAPLTSEPLAKAVQDAKAACIPVILIDRDVDHKLASPNKDYVTFIGSDFIQQGKRAADWLIQKTNGKAKVIELEGTTGATAATNRKTGFDNEIKTASGMTIIASQDADFNRDKGRQTMQTLLQAHPDVTAVYAHNDEMAIGAIAALKAAGKKPGKDVIVVSIDGEKDALNAIIAGELGTTVQSSPFFGPVTFQTIKQYAGGQKLDDWIVVKDQQFTIDNAQQNLASSF
ncbi:MAG: ABC transporter substrate-binding protein [Ktedonobacteraceae bacterium]